MRPQLQPAGNHECKKREDVLTKVSYLCEEPFFQNWVPYIVFIKT